VRAAAEAYRGWALAHPHRYRLLFGSTYGSGALDPERVIPAAHRGMTVTLAALAELGSADDSPVVRDGILKRQLADWGDTPGDSPLPSGVLLLGLVSWTRMHGIVSLEIEGVFEQLGVDPARLYKSEIDHLIAQRAGGD